MAYRATLLLVDDEQEILAELAELLELEGFRCLCASSVMEAMSLLGRHAEIELIITDLRMPEESGLRLIQRLGRSVERADLPIIVTSGHADMDDIVALRLKVLDFFNKPLDHQRLIERLKQLFTRPLTS